MNVDPIINDLKDAIERPDLHQLSCKIFLFDKFAKLQGPSEDFPIVGDTIEESIRDRLGADTAEFKKIEQKLKQFCSMWDEWVFAISQWSKRDLR